MSQRNRTNYPPGSKVICRSNENEPLWIGTIEKWDKLAKHHTKEVPFIRNEETNEVMICFSVIRHYDPLLIEALNKLTYLEQWNVLAEFGDKK